MKLSVLCWVIPLEPNSEYVGVWEETDATLQLHNLKSLRSIYRVRLNNKGQCRTSRLLGRPDQPRPEEAMAGGAYQNPERGKHRTVGFERGDIQLMVPW